MMKMRFLFQICIRKPVDIFVCVYYDTFCALRKIKICTTFIILYITFCNHALDELIVTMSSNLNKCTTENQKKK